MSGLQLGRGWERGVGAGVGTGLTIGVGDGAKDAAVGVGAGVELATGAGAEVDVGTRVTVGVGAGAGCCVISNSSITAEMVSKEGEPSNFVPVWLGSVDRTKMVGVTETSFCRARFMSL